MSIVIFYFFYFLKAYIFYLTLRFSSNSWLIQLNEMKMIFWIIFILL